MNICPYCGKEKKLITLAAPKYMAKGTPKAIHGLVICADCKLSLDNNGSIESISGEYMAYIPDFKRKK